MSHEPAGWDEPTPFEPQSQSDLLFRKIQAEERRDEELRLLRELEANRRSAVGTDTLPDHEALALLSLTTSVELEILAALDRHREGR